MNADIYKRFGKALATWVRSDTDLVTLTGHTANDVRILVRRGLSDVSQVATPCLMMQFTSVPYFPEVDDAIYEAEVVCNAYSTSATGTIDLIGALEALAAEDQETQVSSSFNTDDIFTQTIQSLGPDQLGEALPDEQSVYVSSVTLLIRFIDTK